jgi:hypothetical protein
MAMLESAANTTSSNDPSLVRHTRINPADNVNGYRSFEAGSFQFKRDEYFARIVWPTGSHVIPIDYFLRALMRDIAWGFFYGTVNFDGVFGTTNHYGEVTMFAGLITTPSVRRAGTSPNVFRPTC